MVEIPHNTPPQNNDAAAGSDAAAMTRRSLLVGGGLVGAGLLGGGIALGVGATRPGPTPKAAAPAPSATEGLRTFVSTKLTTPAVHSWRVERPSTGLLFVTQQTKNMGGPGFKGLIMTNKGDPVWIEPTGLNMTDLRVQSLNGKPVLTYWAGQSDAGHGAGAGHILDTSYHEISTVHAGDGLDADLHEFHLTSRGTALMTAYHLEPADLRQIGGVKKGYIYNCYAQEVDIDTGAVLLSWNTSAHVPVADTYLGLTQDAYHDGTSAKRAFDPYHMNAIDEWGDMLLVSLRHVHTVYAIDRTTGAIRWRLGGRHSDFTIASAAQFAWQHDARHQPDGTVTLFDNHLYSGTDGESHGRRFRLDTAARTATLVHDHTFNRHLGTAMGSVQPLADGSVFMGWGTDPYVTEFGADGSVVFQAKLGGMSYRAYRFEWTAAPSTTPDIAARTKDDVTSVYMSWNGATEVSRWHVRAGSSETTLQDVSTVPHSGFETLARILPAKVVTAQALDRKGAVLGSTKTLSA